MFDTDKLDLFTRAYMECALWSSHEHDKPLDENHGITDIAPKTRQVMIADCMAFQRQFATLLAQAYRTGKDREGNDYGPSNAGHDFWLDRNDHGAGFWDRGLEVTGEALSKAAKIYGAMELYSGDDGLIYA